MYNFPRDVSIFYRVFGCFATVMATPVLVESLRPFVSTLVTILMVIPTLPCILNLPGKLTDRGCTDRVLRWYERQEKLNWYGGIAPPGVLAFNS